MTHGQKNQPEMTPPTRRDVTLSAVAAAGESPGAPGMGGRKQAALRQHLASWWPVYAVWAASRIGILLVGLLSQYAAAGRNIPHVSFLEIGTFVHYRDVVANGYTLGNATEFPLLPMLMTLFDRVGLPIAATTFVAVNLMFLVGLVYMAMLGARYVGKDAAIRGAAYLALFPTSYAFSMASTESAMLMLAGLAAYGAMRATPGAWAFSAAAAFTCGLTRPPAILLSLVLAGFALAQWRDSSLRLKVVQAVAAFAPVGGLVAFFLYLQLKTGSFFASLHGQEEFGRSMSITGPFHAVGDAITQLRGGTLGPTFELAAALVIAVFLTWFALRAVGNRWEIRGWVLFGAGSLLMPLATGIVWQMPRFALVIPPVFWMAGRIGRSTWIHNAALVLLPMALAFRLIFEIVGVQR